MQEFFFFFLSCRRCLQGYWVITLPCSTPHTETKKKKKNQQSLYLALLMSQHCAWCKKGGNKHFAFRCSLTERPREALLSIPVSSITSCYLSRHDRDIMSGYSTPPTSHPPKIPLNPQLYSKCILSDFAEVGRAGGQSI